MPSWTLLRTRGTAVTLTAAIVALTLTTAYIHLSLGSLLFTLNGIGYALLAAAVAAGSLPLPILDRVSWLPRLGLAGFTAVTIGGYLIVGPYFSLGWITKAVEAGILVLLAVDVVRVYGSPRGFVRAALSTFREGTRTGPMTTA